MLFPCGVGIGRRSEGRGNICISPSLNTIRIYCPVGYKWVAGQRAYLRIRVCCPVGYEWVEFSLYPLKTFGASIPANPPSPLARNAQRARSAYLHSKGFALTSYRALTSYSSPARPFAATDVPLVVTGQQGSPSPTCRQLSRAPNACTESSREESNELGHGIRLGRTFCYPSVSPIPTNNSNKARRSLSSVRVVCVRVCLSVCVSVSCVCVCVCVCMCGPEIWFTLPYDAHVTQITRISDDGLDLVLATFTAGVNMTIGTSYALALIWYRALTWYSSPARPFAAPDDSLLVTGKQGSPFPACRQLSRARNACAGSSSEESTKSKHGTKLGPTLCYQPKCAELP